MNAASVFNPLVSTLPGSVVNSNLGLLERATTSSTQQVGMNCLTCLHKLVTIWVLSCNLSTLRWCMCRCILDLVNIALFFRQQRQCWQTLYAASTMQRRRTAKSCIDGWEVPNRKVCLCYHVSWCLKICNHEMAPVLYDSKKNTIVI